MTLAQPSRYHHHLQNEGQALVNKTILVTIAEVLTDEVTLVAAAVSVAHNVAADLEMIGHYDKLLRRLELTVLRQAKLQDPQSRFLLQTIPGVGNILSLVLLYEIHTIGRFASVGDFLSYARLVTPRHTSDGKVTGGGGAKIGNAHLKWAFSEAVPAMIRVCDQALLFHRPHEAIRA